MNKKAKKANDDFQSLVLAYEELISEATSSLPIRSKNKIARVLATEIQKIPNSYSNQVFIRYEESRLGINFKFGNKTRKVSDKSLKDLLHFFAYRHETPLKYPRTHDNQDWLHMTKIVATLISEREFLKETERKIRRSNL